MYISKEQFVKDILKLQAKRKQLRIETTYAVARIREHGIRAVTHGKCKAHER